jgi:hypothetical protein
VGARTAASAAGTCSSRRRRRRGTGRGLTSSASVLRTAISSTRTPRTVLRGRHSTAGLRRLRTWRIPHLPAGGAVAGEGVLDVFACGGDGRLWQLSYNGSWSLWTLISGNARIQGQPDALSWDANRINVFVRGPGNDLLTKTFNVQTNVWTPGDEINQIGMGLSGPSKSASDVFVHLLYDGVG